MTIKKWLSNKTYNLGVSFLHQCNTNGVFLLFFFSLLEHPDVVSVLENKGRKLHTTNSWRFLGLENNGAIPSNSLWNLASFGESTIIGNLDTGFVLFHFFFLSSF